MLKKKHSDYIVVIIPARKGSKRLKNKHLRKVWGKPMIYWSIRAAKKSKYVDEIFVSSDCGKIKKICKFENVHFINRPKSLSGNSIYKMEAIIHATKYIIKKFQKPKIVVSLQANSPEVKYNTINKSIDFLVKYNRSEVISVNKKLVQNGCIRTMLLNTVFDKNLSTNIGIIISNETDIHTLSDLKKVNKLKWQN